MEFTKEFVLGLLELKKTDPNKVDESFNSLTDSQHVKFSEALKAVINDIPEEYHNDELKNKLAFMDKNIAVIEDKIVEDEIKEIMFDIELDELAQKRSAAYLGFKIEVRKKL
jgi:hypothetical protein